MSRRILYMVLGGMIALALVGAAMIGGTAVFAQDETPTPPATEDVVPPIIGNGSRGFEANGPRGFEADGLRPQRDGFGDQSTYLADALGITVEELQAAQDAVRTAQMEDVVAQALADGLITQEQADAILAGEGFGRGMRGMRGLDFNNRDEHDALLAAELGISVETLEAAQVTAREAAQAQAIADGVITQEQADLMAAGQALRDYIDQGTILADILGISADELEAAKADGTVRDLIDASGLTQEEIMTAMQTAHETAVAQAVADGVITQEQADQLQALPGNSNLGGPCEGQGHGGRGGHGPGGFGGQRGGGFPGGSLPDTTPNSDAPAAPDTTNTSNNA
jgi:hypothetical protein